MFSKRFCANWDNINLSHTMTSALINFIFQNLIFQFQYPIFKFPMEEIAGVWNFVCSPPPIPGAILKYGTVCLVFKETLYILNIPFSSLKLPGGRGDLRGCIRSFKHLWRKYFNHNLCTFWIVLSAVLIQVYHRVDLYETFNKYCTMSIWRDTIKFRFDKVQLDNKNVKTISRFLSNPATSLHRFEWNIV